jgi:hypothetical protein
VTGVLAVHAVAETLRTYLDDAYARAAERPLPSVQFRLLSSGELAGALDLDNVVTLYLHHVTHNEHLRNATRPVATGESVPLSLDLHFLLTAWATSALAEHAMLAWAMRELAMLPVLDRAVLLPSARWGAGDLVQLSPADLSGEEMTRVWERLGSTYRLSTGYVARTVRIDLDATPDGPPVVARRLHLAPGGRSTP